MCEQNLILRKLCFRDIAPVPYRVERSMLLEHGASFKYKAPYFFLVSSSGSEEVRSSFYLATSVLTCFFFESAEQDEV